MRFAVTKKFVDDFDDTVAWYRNNAPHVEKTLRNAVAETIGRVQVYPEAPPLKHRELRRARVTGFKIGLFYRIKAGTIIAEALLHEAQREAPDSM